MSKFKPKEGDIVYYFDFDETHPEDFVIKNAVVRYVNDVYHYVSISTFKNQLSWNVARKLFYKTKKELLENSLKQASEELEHATFILKTKQWHYERIKRIYDKENTNG